MKRRQKGSPMVQVLPDGVPMPATRAELLSLQDDRVKSLRKQVFSALRALRGGGWVVLIFLVGMLLNMQTLSPPDGEAPGQGAIIVGLGVFLVVALIVLWRLWVHVRQGHRLRVRLDQWYEVDRLKSLQSLPAGDIPVERATCFDARDRSDLDDAVSWSNIRGQKAMGQLRTLVPAFMAIVPGVWGLVFLLGGTLSDDETTAGRVVLVAIGAIMMLPFPVTFWSTTAAAWRRQQALNLSTVEGDLYKTRRSKLTGEPKTDLPEFPPWVRPLSAVVVIIIVIVLVTRLGFSSPIAFVVAIAVLALVGVACLPAIMSRRVLHVVPLLAEGESVLEKPASRISLDFDGTRLLLQATETQATEVSVPVDQILAVTDVKFGYPLSPDAIGIITRDNPFILACTKIKEEPAIVALNDLIAQRASR